MGGNLKGENEKELLTYHLLQRESEDTMMTETSALTTSPTTAAITINASTTDTSSIIEGIINNNASIDSNNDSNLSNHEIYVDDDIATETYDINQGDVSTTSRSSHASIDPGAFAITGQYATARNESMMSIMSRLSSSLGDSMNWRSRRTLPSLEVQATLVERDPETELETLRKQLEEIKQLKTPAIVAEAIVVREINDDDSNRSSETNTYSRRGSTESLEGTVKKRFVCLVLLGLVAIVVVVVVLIVKVYFDVV